MVAMVRHLLTHHGKDCQTLSKAICYFKRTFLRDPALNFAMAYRVAENPLKNGPFRAVRMP
jgi:hypothetical protein